jgi:hypothetical protein
MDIDDDIEGQLRLGHLLLNDRRCRSCGKVKNLIDGFYRTRKNRGSVASSYSYECKECTIVRIMKKRSQKEYKYEGLYPDW